MPDILPDAIDYRLTRRHFLTHSSCGLGAASLASLMNPALFGSTGQSSILPATHFPARAKHVIYLFMMGGPAHMDILDPKPLLQEQHGQEIPPSVRGKQRTTLMTRNQKQKLVAGSKTKFHKYGESGQVMNEYLPHLGGVADNLAIIRSMHSEPINHDPAVNMIQTGSSLPGRPCMGSWASWGLGSLNRDLPDFVVLLAGAEGKPVLSRFYNSGFLPSRHQGVQFQSKGDPVLFLSNPQGIDSKGRRKLIESINALNQRRFEVVGDPEIETRIDSFELAYRMQASVPELMDISRESQHTHDAYGTSPGATSFANNCLLARRLVERGVRFVQLYLRGWDMHDKINTHMPEMCKIIDRPVAALIRDLKQRGLLDETLIVWGGEFGRTAFCQGKLNQNFGRDHHPRCFSMWAAGGGIQGGVTHGQTDDYAFNIVENPVHVHDLQATILHCLGIDHEKLVYRFQGRDQRLTDIGGKVVTELLS